MLAMRQPQTWSPDPQLWEPGAAHISCVALGRSPSSLISSLRICTAHKNHHFYLILPATDLEWNPIFATFVTFVARSLTFAICEMGIMTASTPSATEKIKWGNVCRMLGPGAVCVCVCAQSCLTPCNPMDSSLSTMAERMSISMKFSRQVCWSGLPFPPPGDLPDPGIEPRTPAPPALAGKFFSTVSHAGAATW